MKFSKVLLTILAFAVLIPVSSAYATPETVTICHKPGTPAEQTKTIPSSALSGHLGHGDYEGPCATHEVPEFGMIPGAIALVSSAGTFLYMKRRNS